MNQGKKVYLEIIRIVAVLFVIFNHTDGTRYYQDTSNIITYIYSMAGMILCRTGVPLFFMISGVLLLEKEESLKQLYSKRVKRIAIVLLAISICYYSMDVIRYGIKNASIIDFTQKLLTNGIRESLWFLYAYLGMLIILPFFRKMIWNIDHTLIKYLLLLKAAYDIIRLLLQFFFQINIYLDLGFVGDYVSYMILGWYLDKDSEHIFESIKTWNVILVLLVSVIINICIIYGGYLIRNQYDVSGFDLLVIITAPCIWLTARKTAGTISINSHSGQTISKIGSCVFGIYLLDNFCRWQWLPVYLGLCEKSVGVVACSVYVILVFLTGLLYTFILKKVPGVKNYI